MVIAPICTSLGLSGQLCDMLYFVIFPWVLTFAVIFGLLIKSAIFGDDKSKTSRGVSGLVALSIGFFVTAFTAAGRLIGTFFINMSGNLMMFLFAILGILLVIGLTNKEVLPEKFTGIWGFVILIAVVLLAWFLLGGYLGGGLSFYALFSRDAFAIIIILAVIAGMWWFTCNGECQGKKPAAAGGSTG
jgi:hypothetical protein